MNWTHETGVPIPKAARGKPGSQRTKLHFALKALEPSDSLHIVGGDRALIASCYSMIARNHGQKYVSRRSDQGIRVWRVE